MNRSFCRRRDSRGSGKGFTLIELMIVVAIIAILAAIAVPSYTRYVVKTRRVAAQACLSQYASYMERYYTTNLRYDKDSSATPSANPLSGATPTLVLDCAGASQTGNFYAYTLTPLSASAYTLNATPIGVQAGADSACGTQTLDQAGTRGPATGGCWQ